MKNYLLASALLLTLFLTACQQQSGAPASEEKSEDKAVLETDTQKQSYAVGANMGQFLVRSLEEQNATGLELDKELAIRGFLDATNSASQFDEAEVQEHMQALMVKAQELSQAKAQKEGEENLAKGAAYLAENGQREGVTTTESGLQYEVVTATEGPKPAETDTVKVHYRGTLLDGTEFDSSYARGEPATFPLNRVIKGWTKGLQYMTVGSKYKFHIPADLAYGERATGKITPNSTLVFDVELLEIMGAE
ncbi:MAG: FKBP-type peptidyl-prolyl cis-trans isomerase [Pseudomonadota bacterium]